MSYVVAVYEIDRAYGGPEEGGWWYGTGELKRVIAVCNSFPAAYKKASRANDRLRHQARKQRIDVGSVCYSGGEYSAEVYKDKAPEFYPKHTPHYE